MEMSQLTGNVEPPKKRTKTVHVPVRRSDEIQLVRAELPIFAEETEIIEAVRSHDAVFLRGETGSGKCFAPGTSFLSFSGDGMVTDKLVEDLLVGDRLVGDDAKSRIITSVTSGFGSMFRISCSGTPRTEFCCNDDHILVLRLASIPSRICSTKTSVNVKYFSFDGGRNMMVPRVRAFRFSNSATRSRSLEKARHFASQCIDVGRSEFLWEVPLKKWLKADPIVRRESRMVLCTSTLFAPSDGFLRRILRSYFPIVDGSLVQETSKMIGRHFACAPGAATVRRGAVVVDVSSILKRIMLVHYEKSIAVTDSGAFPTSLLFDSVVEVRLPLLSGALRTSPVPADLPFPVRHSWFSSRDQSLVEKISLLASMCGRRVSRLRRMVVSSWMVIVSNTVQNEDIDRMVPFEVRNLGFGRYFGFTLAGINHRMVLSNLLVSHNTTQVPQFLLEAGFGNQLSGFPGMIGVTQPRRVAAVSMAARVKDELGDRGSSVGYQIRYEQSCSSETVIKFMTDGILLREIQSDFALRKYSVIVLDEAHHRSLNLDLLAGLLSKIVPLRRSLAEGVESQCSPLKVVVMSATLDVDPLLRLFPSAPVIDVDARRFEVTIHFCRRTREDYVGEAFRKVCKIHRRLPAGGVLVFVTSRNEVEALTRRLRMEFSDKRTRAGKEGHTSNSTVVSLGSEGEAEDDTKKERGVVVQDPANSVLGTDPVLPFTEEVSDESMPIESPVPVVRGSKIVELPGGFKGKRVADDVDAFGRVNESDSEDEDENEQEIIQSEAFSDEEGGYGGSDGVTSLEREIASGVGRVHVLPLYAMLPTDLQLRVFRPPPQGARLIVVATNVAESSLTIPNVRYVVDCGQEKVRHYRPESGVSFFVTTWISKASAAQRSGRAGRMSNGHCYRLYSSGVYDQLFPPHMTPEIELAPLAGIALLLKSFRIGNIARFPFPSPPPKSAVAAAVAELLGLGAVTRPQEGTKGVDESRTGAITRMGRSLLSFPLSPRYSRLLLDSIKRNCVGHCASIVAGLSVRDLLGSAADGRERTSMEKDLRGNEVEETEAGNLKSQQAFLRRLRFPLRHRESDLLSYALTIGAYLFEKGAEKQFCDKYRLNLKTLREATSVRSQLLTIVRSFVNARKITSCLVPSPSDHVVPPDVDEEHLLRRSICVTFLDRCARRTTRNVLAVGGASDGAGRGARTTPVYTTVDGQDVCIHPQSALSSDALPPECVCFVELVRSSSQRVYMKGVTEVELEWMGHISSPLIECSRVLDEPPPTATKEGDIICCVRPSLKANPTSWDLPIVKRKLIPSDPHFVHYFAYFILDGTLCPKVARWKSTFLAPPASILRQRRATAPHRRIVLLLDALKDITSLTMLLKKWETSPTFLLPEFCLWVHPDHHAKLRAAWPPL